MDTGTQKPDEQKPADQQDSGKVTQRERMRRAFLGVAMSHQPDDEIVKAPDSTSDPAAPATPAAQPQTPTTPAATTAAPVDPDALAAKVVSMLTAGSKQPDKPAAAPQQAVDPDAGLSDEQKEMLADAEFAEAEYGKTGLVQEHREYFAKVKAWAERNRPDGIEDGDEEFEKFKTSVIPKLPAKREDIKIDRKAAIAARKMIERERAERQRIEQEAGKAKTEEQINAKATDISAKARERVQAAATEALNDLPQESVAELSEEVVTPIARGLASQIVQLERVFNGLPCNDAAAQQKLRGNIAFIAKEFSKKPEAVVDGKRFIDPVEFGQMVAAGKDTSAYWTWDRARIQSELESEAAKITQAKAKKLSETIRRAAQSIAGVRKTGTGDLFSPRIQGSPKPAGDASGKRSLTTEQRYFASLK